MSQKEDTHSSGKVERRMKEGLMELALLFHLVCCKQLPGLPTGINECLMKLCIPLTHIWYATIISAYAPTLTSSDEDKEVFYETLDSLLKATPVDDKLIILDDFSARVGCDTESWVGTLGHHGVGKMNSNGLLLLTLCAENGLSITNTLFRMATKYKTTWMHPRSKQWHLIDYVIVRRNDIQDVTVTRTMHAD